MYVTCALYTLNVYFYLGTYVGSALCTRTNRTYLWSAGQRGARPSVYRTGTQRLPSRDVLAQAFPAFKVFTHAQLITRPYVAGKAWVPRLPIRLMCSSRLYSLQLQYNDFNISIMQVTKVVVCNSPTVPDVGSLSVCQKLCSLSLISCNLAVLISPHLPLVELMLKVKLHFCMIL